MSYYGVMGGDKIRQSYFSIFILLLIFGVSSCGFKATQLEETQDGFVSWDGFSEEDPDNTEPFIDNSPQTNTGSIINNGGSNSTPSSTGSNSAYDAWRRSVSNNQISSPSNQPTSSQSGVSNSVNMDRSKTLQDYADVKCEAPIDQFREAVLFYANYYRANGLNCNTLKVGGAEQSYMQWNAKLEKAALEHALDMVRNRFFSHTGSDGSSPRTRARRYGYSGGVGENIALGSSTVSSFFRGMLRSHAHCVNFMRSGLQDMSIRCVDNYWVWNFGK